MTYIVSLNRFYVCSNYNIQTALYFEDFVDFDGYKRLILNVPNTGDYFEKIF